MDMKRVVDIVTDELFEQLGPHLSREVAANLLGRSGGQASATAEAGVAVRTTKRRPGRPKKEAAANGEAPKRRGRPPKDPNAPKRGPGRPRKTVAAVAESAAPAATVDADIPAEAAAQ